jgi:hypothetical protein
MNAGGRPPEAGMGRDESSSSRGDSFGDYFYEIASRLWVVIMNRVPLGYEDEGGFHLGTLASH